MAEHETDVTSLVLGVLFVGLAAVWALVELDVLAVPEASVVMPVLLIAAGALGLLLSVRRARRSVVRTGPAEQPDQHDQPEDQEAL